MDRKLWILDFSSFPPNAMTILCLQSSKWCVKRRGRAKNGLDLDARKMSRSQEAGSKVGSLMNVANLGLAKLLGGPLLAKAAIGLPLWTRIAKVVADPETLLEESVGRGREIVQIDDALLGIARKVAQRRVTELQGKGRRREGESAESAIIDAC